MGTVLLGAASGIGGFACLAADGDLVAVIQEVCGLGSTEWLAERGAQVQRGITRPVLFGLVQEQRCSRESTHHVTQPHVLLDEDGPEGPYGDHTGYYNSVERFPVFEISAITMKPMDS